MLVSTIRRGTSCLSNRACSISGLVVEYIVAIDATRVRFPADDFGWETRVKDQYGASASSNDPGRTRNYNSRLRRLLREGGTEIVQLLARAGAGGKASQPA